MVPVSLCAVAAVLTVVCDTDSRGMWVGVGFWLAGVLSWLILEWQALCDLQTEKEQAARELLDSRIQNQLSHWRSRAGCSNGRQHGLRV